MKWDCWCSLGRRFKVEILQKSRWRLKVWKTPTPPSGRSGSFQRSAVEETEREHVILQAVDRQSRRSPGSSPMHASAALAPPPSCCRKAKRKRTLIDESLPSILPSIIHLCIRSRLNEVQEEREKVQEVGGMEGALRRKARLGGYWCCGGGTG